MALITFLSDYGTSDHYVAAVKARILSEDSAMNIVDISHHIEQYNIAHGSYVLNAVFRDFPKGSVHLVCLHSDTNLKEPYIALQLEGHFFLGQDNGFFGLISDQEPEAIVQLSENGQYSPFPGKEILAPAASALAHGKCIHELGIELSSYKRMLRSQMKANRQMLAGHVIRVDHYGNLITNLEQQAFETLHDNRPFTLRIGRENLHQIHKNYYEVDSGDCFAMFNSAGLLEIGINKGNASELLGLGYDSRVTIVFN
jgi:S-adenosyl-L-methionine hydrolase (adenosine-forming)